MLMLGDCIDKLKTLRDCSVDAVVTDPPYGLAFMGKKWDYDVPAVEVWAECLRVLKPGGHLLAFAGTRTQHRMAVRIEDAGFEIRDMIAWVYGSGFPKSLDVSKAIDRMDASEEQERRRLRFTAWVRSKGVTARQIDEATGTNMGGHYTTLASQPAIMTREHLEACRHLLGDVPAWVEQEADIRSVESKNFAEREVVGTKTAGMGSGNTFGMLQSEGDNASANKTLDITAPATDAAKQWQGWGTALKPAIETVTFASKPYTDKQERDIIQSNLFRLEVRLWLLSHVSSAVKSSTSSQSEFDAACAIAQWSADEITSTQAALCDQMGTSLFELATTTSLNIVSSWRRTLDESWSDGNTSTTETKLSTTIDWRTLKFSLSQITPASIIKACSLPGGFSANASTAENHFSASLSLLQSIRTLSATEPAISQEAENCRGADVKPNLDPCIMARKPLAGTVAENVLQHGTGGINVDGCRVPHGDEVDLTAVQRQQAEGTGIAVGKGYVGSILGKEIPMYKPGGRWPANLIHDGSDEVCDLFPQTSSGANPTRRSGMGYHGADGQEQCEAPRGSETGTAARFFYCAKASKRDRDEGCEGMVAKARNERKEHGKSVLEISGAKARNHHPTVKPTALMRYLCRLITPPGGLVLDPFMGSGSTGKGAILEGFRFIGIERDPDYMQIAESRIKHAQEQAMEAENIPHQLELEVASA